MFKGELIIRRRRVASVPGIIVLVLLVLYLGAIASSSQRPSVAEVSQPKETIKKVYEVTLVTGDLVEVGITNASRMEVLSIKPSDPEKLNQFFQIWEDGNGLYVVPAALDMRRVDLELFNVKYLIEEGYYNETYIPLILMIGGSTKAIARSDTEQRITKKDAGEVEAEFGIIPAIAVKVLVRFVGAIFSSLMSSPYLGRVCLDRKVSLSLSDSVPLIDANDVWTLGYNGTGIKIAIIDTGVDSSHPDLAGKVTVNVDFSDDSNVNDLVGHGTHCASIAAGTGAASGGLYKGVAPGATLWNVKVLNRQGWGYDSWIISGVQYAAYGPDGNPSTGDEADILSLSLGADWNNDGTDPLALAVDDAVSTAGRVVVVAAGNNGYGNYYTVGTPGTSRKAITVGASDKSDLLASFSSLGPTGDFRVKPDLLAPGVGIIAARATNAIYPPFPSNNQYTQLSGTSMATPHVAGVAALLKQKYPSWSTSDIKNALTCSAINLGYNGFQQGGGRVDALAAAQTALLAEPATVSLGQLNKGTTTSFDVSFRNIGTSTLVIGLSPNLRNALTGQDVSSKVSLNVTSLTIAAGNSKGVHVTINAVGLATSLYSGVVNTNYAAAGISYIHVTFGFLISNKIVATVIGLDGNPVAGALVYAFKSRATSTGYSAANYTDNNGHANLYLYDGTIYTIGAPIDAAYAAAYAVDKRDISADTSITLDLRVTNKLSYRPPAPNQVMASISSSLLYLQSNPNPNVWFGIGYWSYYPASSDIYCGSTDLNLTSYYQHYPKEWMVVSDPSILASPELYSISFVRRGVSGPEVLSVNQSDLAKITRQYRVAVTPSVGAEIYRDAISWFQVGSLSWGFISDGATWNITVPTTLDEWISPSVDYLVLYRKTSDAPNTVTPSFDFSHQTYLEYAPSSGYYVSPAGANPLAPDLYVTCSSHDGGTKGDLYLQTGVFTDVGSFMNLLSSQGRLVVKRNGTTVADTGSFTGSLAFLLYNLQLPGKFQIELYGASGLRLSTQAYSRLEFAVPVGGSFSLPVPFLFMDVPGLDSNNTIVAGNIQGLLFLSLNMASNPTVEYSTDDELTWQSAQVTRNAHWSGYFNFTIGALSDAYVSLRVNGTSTNGVKFTHSIMRGLYVKKAPSVSQPSVVIEDTFVQSGIVKINATLLSPSRITGAQYAIDSTSSPTNVPAPVDGTYDSTDERIHIEIDARPYSGLHVIYIRCFDAEGYPGPWKSLQFSVSSLNGRYNLIALTLSPRTTYSAADLGKAIGPAATLVAKWDLTTQKFLSYSPGVSGPEKNFILELGKGYFVYLSSAQKFVEVEEGP